MVEGADVKAGERSNPLPSFDLRVRREHGVARARRCSDACVLKRVEGGVRRHGRRPCHDRIVKLVVCRLPSCGVGEPLVFGEIRASEHLREAMPGAIILDRETQPATV
jgi:hypothetical protein